MTIELKVEQGLDIGAGFDDNRAAVSGVAAVGSEMAGMTAIETMTTLAAAAGSAGDDGLIYKQLIFIWGWKNMDFVGRLEIDDAVFQSE